MCPWKSSWTQLEEVTRPAQDPHYLTDQASSKDGNYKSTPSRYETAENEKKCFSTNCSEGCRPAVWGHNSWCFVQEEVSHVKDLLQEAEENFQTEAERRKEAEKQLVKLTEMKALLQQQVEGKSSGTVAEKQVKSLEARLQVTEERLHSERANRASHLSEVENKLISENSRLQVSEKTTKKKKKKKEIIITRRRRRKKNALNVFDP